MEVPEATGSASAIGAKRSVGVSPVLPLSDVVLFPGMVMPLVIQTQRSTRLVDDVVAGDRMLLAVLQRNSQLKDDVVTHDDLHGVGCLARVLKMLKFPDETIRILAQGVGRVRIGPYETHPKYLTAKYAAMTDEVEAGVETEALMRNCSQRFQEIISLSPTLPEELKIAIFNLDEPGKLADAIAAHLNMPIEERQALLEETKPRERLLRLNPLLTRELAILRLGTEIQQKVTETFTKNQREYFLREQMKTIKKELGEQDQQQAELKDLDEKIARAKMPAEIEAAAKKEKERLQSIPSASPEYTVARTYLDWLTELPWAVTTEDKLDITAARRILDEDHYDLKPIKERILEYLSVLKLKRDLKGPILCFVGPPGVGKTSLGQSIARALGRKFVRMSLGGMHDEAEIRGHRRTYIGAMPGRIIQGLRKVGSRNPVFMLDEIDKVGQDFRGDPSSALLEVLDPEQNSTFTDLYLNQPFDLSRVLFITTGNLLDTIQPALRDRMEILELSGYTQLEKRHIAEKYLVPRQVAAHGLKKTQVSLATGALERVISDYTREAGVRALDLEIASLCRKAARKIAEGRSTRVRITADEVPNLLGPKRFDLEIAERTTAPGVATGLAWTPAGGDILFIEASQMPGKGNLILTGSLGDVMKESAQAALSYVRANAVKFGLPADATKNADFHIHVPAGATPKDGPSAGLALITALVSLLTKRSVASDVAMTGEITLRGKVLPVGGIKEKVLAASRAGIKRVLLPVNNRRNLRDIPPEVRRAMKFTFVQKMDAAVLAALAPVPTRKASRK
ncbi:MAG: endopeptidase La [Verrucomicrobia bacterium]|nr:MAG: endopeptidase La [Verrucomicrobiota bacterium]